MKFSFFHDKRRISLDVREIKGIERGIGLMFRTINTNSLLFRFNREKKVAITSWFVFFPFLAIWINENRKITEFCVVRPFTLSLKPKKPSKWLVEVPLNEKNRKKFRNLIKN